MPVRILDGVGVIARGDLLLILYVADARLHRTRWLFDQADELVARCPDGVLSLMVIGEHSGLPDAPTRAENTRRLDKLGGALRRLVTVPLGDGVRANLVRAVMRAMLLVQGKSDRLRIAPTEAEGIRQVGLVATSLTPGGNQIRADLADLHADVDGAVAARVS